MTGDSGCLCLGGNVSGLRLLLHLTMALLQVKDFDEGVRKDFMHCVSRRATSLPVQVIALNKDRVVGEAAEPNISCKGISLMRSSQRSWFLTFSTQRQLDAFPDVEASLLALISAVHVRQRSQTKAVASGRIHVPVDDDTAER